MKVKELIEKLKECEKDAIICAGFKEAHPIKDAKEITDLMQITKSDKIANAVILQMD